MISGQHDHVNSHVPELTDRLRTVRLDRVRDRDNAEQHSVSREKQRRLSRFRVLFRFLPDRFRHLHLPGNEFQAPADQFLISQFSLQAVPRQSRKSCDLLRGNLSVPAIRKDSFCERMLALCLERAGCSQKFLL